MFHSVSTNYIVETIPNNTFIWYVLCHHCSWGYKHPIPNMTITNYLNTISYKNIVSNSWCAFTSVATNKDIWMNCAVFTNDCISVNDKWTIVRKV